MKKTKTQRLVLCALLMAMHVVLSYISIDLPITKLNLAHLPIIVGGMIFGPMVGFVVGFVGDFLYQILKFGLMATTIMWVIPAAARGLLIGLYAKWRKFNLGKIETVILITITSFIVTFLNTVGLYIAGFLSEITFQGVIWPRLVSAVFASVVYSVIVLLIIKPLKRFFKNGDNQ